MPEDIEPAGAGDCLFCRFVTGEVPLELVHESTGTIAFADIAPQAPTHVLVVPRAHHRTAADLVEREPDLMAELVRAAAAVAARSGLERGYRLVLNTGPDAQQSVHHVHLHLLGGRSFGWPPG